MGKLGAVCRSHWQLYVFVSHYGESPDSGLLPFPLSTQALYRALARLSPVHHHPTTAYHCCSTAPTALPPLPLPYPQVIIAGRPAARLPRPLAPGLCGAAAGPHRPTGRRMVGGQVPGGVRHGDGALEEAGSGGRRRQGRGRRKVGSVRGFVLPVGMACLVDSRPAERQVEMGICTSLTPEPRWVRTSIGAAGRLLELCPAAHWVGRAAGLGPGSGWLANAAVRG